MCYWLIGYFFLCFGIKCAPLDQGWGWDPLQLVPPVVMNCSPPISCVTLEEILVNKKVPVYLGSNCIVSSSTFLNVIFLLFLVDFSMDGV